MFMAQLPQMPSRQLRRKVSDGSYSFLILSSASSTIGPQSDRSTCKLLSSRAIQEIDQPTLIPHIAEAKSQKYSYEVLFRSLQKLLIDTATSEYLFTDDFFGEESIFHDIFAVFLKCFLSPSIISWASGALDPEGAAAHSSLTSIKRGVWAMIAAFLAYCTLQAPSTILIRPHPAVWHLVHGLAVVYLVALTFLLFQNCDDARQFMKLLHPDLGVELPERSYGADCRLRHCLMNLLPISLGGLAKL
uniref:CDP-diacylglycerol--serine O-phosphatidyltransferase n=1 Tax=Zea mays TaxID=4577 RepID=A0A804Q4B0_MAIZE